MITQQIHQANGTTVIGTRQFRDQIEADLATGVRGGNKFRLIARIWWHKCETLAQVHDADAYLAFRTAQAIAKILAGTAVLQG